MKKIEDYIHFYLGCPCQYLMLGRGIVSEVSIDSKYGILVSVKLDGSIKHIQCPLSYIKLIVRPFSDMTEEEKSEAHELYFTGAYETLLPYFGIAHYELTRWLLSKHFDLFGLIEDGLAINSTTLK